MSSAFISRCSKMYYLGFVLMTSSLWCYNLITRPKKGHFFNADLAECDEVRHSLVLKHKKEANVFQAIGSQMWGEKQFKFMIKGIKEISLGSKKFFKILTAAFLSTKPNILKLICLKRKAWHITGISSLATVVRPLICCMCSRAGYNWSGVTRRWPLLEPK